MRRRWVAWAWALGIRTRLRQRARDRTLADAAADRTLRAMEWEDTLLGIWEDAGLLPGRRFQHESLFERRMLP